MNQLVSEVFLDPTNTVVFIESGDAALPIGIDFELDYPTTRVLRIYNRSLADAPPAIKMLPVSASKISIADYRAFYELVDFASEDKEIYFILEIDDSGENVDLFIYTSIPLVLLREDFGFLNFSRDLYIVDENGAIIQKLENPNHDEEFNNLFVEYFDSAVKHAPPYSITNFINGYSKRLFTDNLETCKIEFI